MPNTAWDRGLIFKKRVDPQKYVELNYPAAVDYRILLVGDQGTAELRRGRNLLNPVAVYPTWEYGSQPLEELIEMLQHPIGLNQRACADMRLPPDERPVLGQEHRVVITRYPDAATNVGRAFLRELADLQAEFPDAIIHIHGTYSFRVAFGMGFGAADLDVREAAAGGRVHLGNGKAVRWQEAPKYAQWVHLNGATFGELEVPRNRCIFNIKSALWAAENYAEAVKFNTKPSTPADPFAAKHVPATTIATGAGTGKPGDKFTCDTCSLSKTCKYARAGGVCTIPDSEPARLASFFKTRDSDRIIEGLGKIMEIQAKRAEAGIANEEFDGGLDPEVTKLMNSMFANGVKLAKLVDPALAAAGAPKVGIQINTGGAMSQMTPNAMMAAIVGELEAKGIPREQITPEMISDYIAGRPAVPAIEATVRES